MERVIVFYKNLFFENKIWLRKVATLFVFAVIAGVALFFYDQSLLGKILEIFKDKFGENPELNFDLVLTIFRQNIIAAGFALIGGLILGLAPIVIVAINGLILGYVVASIFALAPAEFGSNLSLVLGGLLPHAVLELPAILLASALGLRLGVRWIKRESSGDRFAVLKRDMKQAIFAIPAIAFILFAAALVEVFVSGNLIK